MSSRPYNDKWTGKCYWCYVPILRPLDFVKLKITERPHFKLATKDHILPLFNGGMKGKANVEFACMDCNAIRTVNQEAEIKAALQCPLIKDKLNSLQKTT